ncbi:glycosyltransferase [Desulfobulbus alkaliphilus]|uniref:glycosyltransferase n=1 Tax=Desulfobulbus alkaliphilus TaxID=869814 RepID=UPI00196360D4|nr:glycosyltransferase [Desulfobulbus alkaliphilus]MBM9538526.1 glycosyltransferase [Desulfobulbus alkaliphilus]
MQSINLLYVIQSLHNGGAETLAIRLAEHLDKQRFNPLVCSLHDEGPLRGQLAAQNIPHVTLAKKQGIDLPLIFRIRSLLKAHNINLVHTHNQGPLLYTSLAAIGLRRCTLVHTEHINLEKEFSYSRKHFYLNKFLLRRADGFLSIAEHLSNYYRTCHNLSHVNFTTIHNSVVLPDLSQSPLTSLRRELGLRGDQPLIGNISALRSQKDHATLIRAMPAVLEQTPDAVLVIAGDGELKQELSELARELNLGTSVRFLGYRSDVNELLLQFDLFVLSSLYEGLPLSILEAMAAGVPVVATDADGTNEIVRHDETGLLVPLQDPAALAQAMLSLLHDRPRAQAMGTAARELIRVEYNLENMIARYENYYEQVVSNNPTSRAKV